MLMMEYYSQPVSQAGRHGARQSALATQNSKVTPSHLFPFIFTNTKADVERNIIIINVMNVCVFFFFFYPYPPLLIPLSAGIRWRLPRRLQPSPSMRLGSPLTKEMLSFAGESLQSPQIRWRLAPLKVKRWWWCASFATTTKTHGNDDGNDYFPI